MSYEQCKICGGWTPPVRPAFGSRSELTTISRSESVTDGSDGDCGSSVSIMFVCIAGFTAGGRRASFASRKLVNGILSFSGAPPISRRGQPWRSAGSSSSCLKYIVESWIRRNQRWQIWWSQEVCTLLERNGSR
jgi:hypothetical protein